MTVNTAISTATYTGNAATTVFTVPFYFLVNGDLIVQQKIAATGTVNTLVLNSDYTLAGAGNNAGGTLTMTVAPASGDTLYIARNVSEVQQTAYPPNTSFPASAHEMALDRLTMITQQLTTAVNLALTRSPLGQSYNLGGAGLTNSADGVAATDLVTVEQLASGLNNTGTVNAPFVQSGLSAVSRTVQAKLRDIVHVADFGAVGDWNGSTGTDNTAAINAAIASLPAYGGRVMLGRGGYKITAPITILNSAVEIWGEGREASRIVQVTAATNGINFTSNTTGNALAGNGTMKNTLSLRNFSLLRGLTAGGFAVNASWISTTDNMPYFYAENIMVYGDNNGGEAWGEGFKLTNVNGTRMVNVAIKGNPFETALLTAEPYTMEAAIHFTGDTAGGHIDHHLTGIVAVCCNKAVKVDAWYEGVYVSNFEFVQVSKGVFITGYSVSLNPVFHLTNGHMDFREGAIDATNQQSLQLCNINLIKNGGAPVAGFAGNAINLVNSGFARFVAVDMTNFQTTAAIFGIVADVNSFQGSVTGGSIRSFTGVGLQLACVGWVVAGQAITSCGTGIVLTGIGNTFGANSLSGNTTDVIDSGGNVVAPKLWSGVVASTFGTTGVTQAITIPVPTGVFSTTPRSVFSTEQFNTGNQLVFVFDRTASSATSIVLRAQRNDGASISSGGSYSIAVLAST